jgi:archaellum biogenesis ATPase FlaH
MTLLKDYYDIIEKLTASELNKLEVIKWLVSDDQSVRRTGRTRLMAIAFVRLALEGKRSKIFDHFQGKNSKQFIINAIDSIFKSPDIKIVDDVIESKEAILADGAVVVPGITKEEVLQSLLLDFRTLCGLLMGSGVPAGSLHAVINILEVESIMKS